MIITNLWGGTKLRYNHIKLVRYTHIGILMEASQGMKFTLWYIYIIHYEKFYMLQACSIHISWSYIGTFIYEMKIYMLRI